MMISFKDNIFCLDSVNSSYFFQITKFGHLENIYYGERLRDQDLTALLTKRTAMIGSTVAYDESDSLYSLDTLPLEWSGIGKGDYRHTPAEIRMPDGSFVTDFIYQSHQIISSTVPMTTLPSAYDDSQDCETLEITLEDKSNCVTLLLYYSLYAKTDVITRRTVLRNNNQKPLQIRKLMSMMIDLPSRNYNFTSFHGAWIKEAHRQDRKLHYGLIVNQSTTGASSNRQNPGFLLSEQGATETNGRVYGFNLVYSGNHYGAVELSHQDLVRVMIGINPLCFEWELGQEESFETPEAIMTFSNKGFNGMSQHFHDFVNEHIVRGDWKGRERPILINNWEAHFHNFNQRKLLHLARQAKKLGVELFVLDDGWFGKRDSDTAGLGDYNVNPKKLPRGLSGLAGKLNKMGLEFGLWFEPEMVNKDSDLYRAHPEYVVEVPGRQASLGRNQLVLDLCNPAVRDYIVHSVRNTLASANITYVKWDMNRHISDMFSPAIANQGEFFHRYILGLYDILTRIFKDQPHILFESCSSGGNRFDLGMLCFSPQIWASDDTDPVERLEIQGGLSYLYPVSTMGAHVSLAPHQQTLRSTPLSTRFNVSSFGCLGYELDLKYLSHLEKKEMANQIAYYKQYRKTLQFGRFYRLDPYKKNKVHWECVNQDQTQAVAGFFQSQMEASEGFDFLPLTGLKNTQKYKLSTRSQTLYVRRFGALINHILPFHIHPEGFILRMINKFYAMNDCVEEYEGYGDLLQAGVKLNNQFVGSYYNSQTRLLGDFGSNLYTIQAIE